MKRIKALILAVAMAVSSLSFGANEASAASTVAVYRMYNPNSGEHFYTTADTERDTLIRAGWRFEGIGWYAVSSGDSVYRLYNPNAGDHHYTMSASEKDNLVKCGWKYEGVSFFSDRSKTIPVYREYNPNAKKAGAHNYTTDNAEHKSLVKLGWKDEGTGFYAAAKGVSAKIVCNKKADDWKSDFTVIGKSYPAYIHYIINGGKSNTSYRSSVTVCNSSNNNVISTFTRTLTGVSSGDGIYHFLQNSSPSNAAVARVSTKLYDESGNLVAQKDFRWA